MVTELVVTYINLSIYPYKHFTVLRIRLHKLLVTISKSPESQGCPSPPTVTCFVSGRSSSFSTEETSGLCLKFSKVMYFYI